MPSASDPHFRIPSERLIAARGAGLPAYNSGFERADLPAESSGRRAPLKRQRGLRGNWPRLPY